MSALKAAIQEARVRGFPQWHERRTEVAKAAAKLPLALDGETTGADDGEALVRRAHLKGLGSLKPIEQRRVLPFLLRNPADAELALECLNAVVAKGRRSDAAVIRTWVGEFPGGAVGEQFAGAARGAAERHIWPWKDAGIRFNLWDRLQAPRTIGAALLLNADPEAIFSAVGLSPAQLSGQLPIAAMHATADQAADTSDAAALRTTTALLGLAEALEDVAVPVKESIARGLLHPWSERVPPDDLRGRAKRWLLRYIGDPRRDSAAWKQVTQALDARGIANGETLAGILRRWQVREHFDFFFATIGRSTTDRIAWAERENFWRWFIDQDYINDAWFVLGKTAEQQAGPELVERGLLGQYGRHDGNADAATSALLLRIGDLVVSEWTQTGSCCVWEKDGPERPILGSLRYDDRMLRNSERMKVASIRQAGRGREKWRAFPHNGNWQNRLGNHIADLTGMHHPDAR